MRRQWRAVWLTAGLLLPLAAEAALSGGLAIERLLVTRLAGDNASRALAAELAAAAHYYAQFPELEPLFARLERSRFTIAYGDSEHRTAGAGAALTVYFDPLSAAQYQFRRSCQQNLAHCRAAPADVLLHELLHVAVLNSRWTGAAPLYPFAHEQAVIDQEAHLYAAMSARDGKPRPLRVEHHGRPVRVACALCVR